jgi:L-threonylcarbamoyladenylate synthase
MKIIKQSDQSSAKIAASLLAEDKVVAIPTDTVYGLAVNAASDRAVNKLYQLKKRDSTKPIAIFAPDIDTARKIVVFSQLAEKIIAKYGDQPFTLVLPKRKDFAKDFKFQLSPFLNQNDEFLGIRIVKNEFISRLFAEIFYLGNFLLAVTSANISNQKDATSINQVANYFSNDLELLVDNCQNSQKLSSTVIKIIGNDYQILRAGEISESKIKFLL